MSEIEILIYADRVAGTISGSITYENLWLSLDEPLEEWEPFTGGEPSPSLDYPQVIRGVGDTGFFDGELLQGYYKAADGVFISYHTYVCNYNKIPCETGDKIALESNVSATSFYFIFYDKDGNFLSSKSLGTGKQFESDVPQNGKYFCFNIGVDSGITPQSVKHITVTINGMYAICVKMHGVNICEGVESGAWLHSNGNPSTTGDYVRTRKMQVKENTTYKESCVSDLDDVAKTVVFWDKNGSFLKYQSISTSIQTPSNCGYMAINYNKSGLVLGNIRDAMVAELNIFPETFIPYQSNTTYIPISSPLFDGDKLIKGNKEYKILRKKKLAVFDGDEAWSKATGNESAGLNNFVTTTDGKLEPGYCDKFKSQNTAIAETTEEGILFQSLGIYVRIKSSKATDASGFKKWLQSNPITCVYTLATPMYEELTPEAQKDLYSILSCDEQTTIEIVGDQSTVSFIVPRTLDAAISSTALCQSKINTIDISSILNLESRVNKLEIDTSL